MELLLTLIFLLCTYLAVGQSSPAPTPRKRPVKVSLLSSYFEQDGVHSAVNGGRGSQQLSSFAQEGLIFIPFMDSSGMKVQGGLDYFTSASMQEIDKYQTSASTGMSKVSGDETRYYASLGFDLVNKVKKTVISPSFGVSKEYDMLSFNGGYSWNKKNTEQNRALTIGGGFIADRWMVVYPGEFRGAVTTQNANSYNNAGYNEYYGSGASMYYETGASTGYYYETPQPTQYDSILARARKTITKDDKTYPVAMRYSGTLSSAYSFVINKRMNALVGLDGVAQWGLLSTPFHRVYFNDGVTDEQYKEVRVEKLPGQRLKAALYGRYNYYIHPLIGIRTFARLYYDSWDVKAFAFTVEAPLRLTQLFSLNPFYRFHTQYGARYFAPYGKHYYTPGSYYTSDWDLADLTSHKIGATLRLAKVGHLTGIRSEDNKRIIFGITSLDLRYAAYLRNDGLNAHILSLELNFEF